MRTLHSGAILGVEVGSMGTVRTVAILVGVLLLVAGCAAAPPASAPTTSLPSATTTPSPLTPPSREFRSADSGVYANLFLPPAPGRHRAVLVLGGSEGGVAASSFMASMLARQGFVAMAVAYFKEPGLPALLSKIPIEYFQKATRLLATQPEVDPAHVAVWGTSRGSEAAALTAAHTPDVLHGVVLQSPSSVAQADELDGPSWTWQGVGVPTSPSADWNDPAPADARAALLPITKISGPIVTVCGDEDAIWAACPSSAEIVKLAAPRPVTALRYPLAGHAPMDIGLLTDSGRPPTDLPGGSLADDVAAGRDAFAHVVAILRATP